MSSEWSKSKNKKCFTHSKDENLKSLPRIDVIGCNPNRQAHESTADAWVINARVCLPTWDYRISDASMFHKIPATWVNDLVWHGDEGQLVYLRINGPPGPSWAQCSLSWVKPCPIQPNDMNTSGLEKIHMQKILAEQCNPNVLRISTWRNARLTEWDPRNQFSYSWNPHPPLTTIWKTLHKRERY